MPWISDGCLLWRAAPSHVPPRVLLARVRLTPGPSRVCADPELVVLEVYFRRRGDPYPQTKSMDPGNGSREHLGGLNVSVGHYGSRCKGACDTDKRGVVRTPFCDKVNKIKNFHPRIFEFSNPDLQTRSTI